MSTVPVVVNKPQPELHELAIDSIVADHTIHCRTFVPDRVVNEYEDLIADGVMLPPLHVFRVFKDRYLLADGFIRLAALKQAGVTAVKCYVHQGTPQDALAYGIEVNARQGIRLSPEDKRRAIKKLLLDPVWSRYSNRKIANRCKVSPTLVGWIRDELVERGQSSESSERVYERNGTTHVMDVNKIGESNKRSKSKPTTPAVVNVHCPKCGCQCQINYSNGN